MRFLLTFVLVLTTLFIPKLSNATMGWDIGRVRTGFILTRGVVLSEAGNVIYSYYNADGTVAGDIGEAVGPLEGAKVISGEEYRAIYNYYQQIKTDNADGIAKGAYIMSAEVYAEKEFFTVNGEKVNKSPLLPGVKSVYVRADNQLLIPENDPSLVQAQINLSGASSISSSVQSVLLDNEGNVHTASDRTIGPKTHQHTGALRPGDEPEGAVSGTLVEVLAPFGSATITDENGYFAAPYALYPCPGVQVFSSTGTIINFGMRNFNPKGVPVLNYPMIFMHYDSDFCSGLGAQAPGYNLTGLMAQVAVIGIEAAISHPVVPLNYYLDINVINGEGFFSNDGFSPIPVGDTGYKYEAPDDTPITQTQYDFDGDGAVEETRLGNIIEVDGEDKFTICVQTDDEKQYQGIYLSSGGKQPNIDCDSGELPEDTQPDFIRLADRAPDFRDQGLLKGISEEDFKDTDLYVFRESNGMLITERNGLKDNEVALLDAGGVNEGKMYYQMTVRGPKGIVNAVDNLQNLSFSGFQSAQQMNPELHAAKSDHLRPFEQIRVVAINRKTGYMGTVRAAFGTGNSQGLITFPINDIVMGPPNLSIKAERQYEVERGMTAGEEREYLIGYEGASLTSDTIVKITTEWFDVDGSPLPAGLNDVGFTGRLAKVVGTNQLIGEGGKLAQFAIKPGYHVEQVKLGGEASEHYYVQVSPESITGDPNFGGSANGPGPLKYRPANYVPIKVPLMDETLSWQQFRAYQQLKRDGQADDIPKPKPIYRWFYRPEMQFSMYDLEVESIFTEEGDEQSVDIYPLDSPVVAATDDAVRIAYSIIEQSADALEYLGVGQELVFAFGEQEIKAEIGEDRQIHFTNIDHLAQLEPEDFLSMRLYSNNDPGNILWEYGFVNLSLFPARNESIENEYNIIEISADNAAASVQSVNAYITANGDEGVELPVTWQVEGSGYVEPQQQSSNNGVYNTNLTLPTSVGSMATVYATFGGSKFYSTSYKIVPGEASDIKLVQNSGKTVIGGLGEITWQLQIQDRHGNMMPDGTNIYVVSPGVEVVGPTVVTDGIAQVKFKGGNIAGQHQVSVRVGTAEYTGTIEVHDVDLSFVDLANVEVFTQTPITVQATSTYGSLEGLQLNLAVHRGKLASNIVTLNGSNSATTTFDSGEFRGFAQISAKVLGTRKAISEDFNVTDQKNYLDSTVLVIPDGAQTNRASTSRVVDQTIDLGNGATISLNDSTFLNINGNAGENVSPSLVDIFLPPMYAMLDYTTELGISQDDSVVDISSGIDADSQNVALVAAGMSDYNLAWQFDFAQSGSAYIDVPSHQITDNLLDAGVNFWLKIPDLSTLSETQTLVDWDELGIQVQLNPDGTLTTVAFEENNSEAITHSQTVVAGKWHQLAIHVYQNEVLFGIDGVVETKALATGLKGNKQQAYNLRVGGDISQLSYMSITGFKVYDWQGDAKVTFGDGSFKQDITLDVEGKSRVLVTAHRPVTAYTRQYGQKSLLDIFRQGVTPYAYANDAVSACKSSYSPIDPDSDDANIRRADQYLTMLLECFVKPQVEKARINYQTSDGFFETSVAVIELGSITAIYEVLKQSKTNAVAIVNCLDAALTGSNSSAVGVGCDFVTSMLAIGDLRDILIQSWHYNLGFLTGTEKEYDELTAQLAAVGLIASASQLIPAAGQTAGVVATAFVGVAKAVAKGLKRIGEEGRNAAKMIARKLGKVMDNPNASLSDKASTLDKMLPFMEISAQLVIIHNNDPRILPFLADMLTSAKTLDNMIDWTNNYLKKLDAELSASTQHQLQNWLQPFIETANAALAAGTKAKFIAELRETFDGMVNIDVDMSTRAGIRQAAEHFDDALESFLRLVNEPDFSLSDIKSDMYVINAFINVRALGSADTVKKLAKHRGYTIGLNSAFTREHFIQAFAKMPVNKLTDDAKRGVVGLINSFDNRLGFDVTKGNIAHVLMISDMLRRKDIEILQVEHYLDPLVTPKNSNFAGRRVDIQIRKGDQIIDVEVKNVFPHRWKSLFSGGMKKKPKKKADGEAADTGTDAAQEVAERTGQLYTDIVRYIQDGFKGKKYVFTPDVMEVPDSVTDKMAFKRNPANQAKAAEDMIKYIKQLVKKNEAALAGEFKLNLKIPQQKRAWETMKQNLFNAMDGKSGPKEKFVEIYGYEQILNLEK